MKEDCREILEQAYLYLDGEFLSESQRIEIERHLEECAPCLERVGLDQEVQRVVSRLKGAHPCPHRLKVKISALVVEMSARYQRQSGSGPDH
jgi:mycothiol system anti-sigma-R factor